MSKDESKDPLLEDVDKALFWRRHLDKAKAIEHLSSAGDSMAKRAFASIRELHAHGLITSDERQRAVVKLYNLLLHSAREEKARDAVK